MALKFISHLQVLRKKTMTNKKDMNGFCIAKKDRKEDEKGNRTPVYGMRNQRPNH